MQESGWSSLAFWRKLIYYLIALILGSVFASPLFALGAILQPLALLGLVAWGFFTWRVYLFIRSDVDYVDSDSYAQMNPRIPDGSRHWP